MTIQDRIGSILVIGGYGGFGARLSRRLASAGYRVIVAGRSIDTATRFAATLPGAIGAAIDIASADLTSRIAATGATIVVDAAGPFQGAQPLVAEAAIALGIYYCDLADARDFVTGIAALDEQARAAGVAVISGASSVPALSGAVVRHLSASMQRVTVVDIAISASNRGGAGRSVASAMLASAGRRFDVPCAGRTVSRFGWQSLSTATLAVGSEPLGTRLFADVDVPDLALLPDRLPGRPSVRFRAGTDRAVQVVGLWLVAGLVRMGVLRSGKSLTWLMVPLQRATGIAASAQSGMTVLVMGEAGGRRISRRWTLIVGNGQGPEVPTLAAAALIDAMSLGDVAHGARDAGDALTLNGFQAGFASIGARQDIMERHLPPPLYQQIMGASFAALPPAVRAMHNPIGTGGAHGRLVVTRGAHPLARLIASIMRFPGAGEHDVHVAFEESETGERWTRDFSGQRFSSHLSARGGRLVERFGPLRFAFDLPGDADGLRMVLRGWWFGPVPLPIGLAPRTDAREWEEDGCFHLDVGIALPWIGSIVRYRGWLVPIA